MREAKRRLPKEEEHWCGANRWDELLEYQVAACTLPFRGRSCAMAERVKHKLFTSTPHAVSDGETMSAYELANVAGLMAHAATDAPKHFSPRSLWTAVTDFQRFAGVSAFHHRNARDQFGHMLRMRFSAPLRVCTAWDTIGLDMLLERSSWGKIWLPRKTVLIEEELAPWIAAAWRELRFSSIPRVERDGRRSPAYEIALFLAEKARRGCTGGGGFQYCLSTLDHRRIVLALRQCRRGMPITEISTLLKSWLL